MAEDDVISVSFLRETYPQLEKKKDEQLQKIVDMLGAELITERSDLEFVSRETLLAKNISGLFVDIVKPARGMPLCCRLAIYC